MKPAVIYLFIALPLIVANIVFGILMWNRESILNFAAIVLAVPMVVHAFRALGGGE